MWLASGRHEPQKYLECDALHHTGKCTEVSILLYKRRNPTGRKCFFANPFTPARSAVSAGIEVVVVVGTHSWQAGFILKML